MRVGTLSLILVLFCNEGSIRAQDSSRPFILGRTVEIHSAQLSENRILNIYLPEGYDAKDSATYPVIYLLDGGAEEDFIHIVGLVQFSSFEWIHRVPRSIVVGIANVDRRGDFTYPTTIAADSKQYPTTGRSANFISFLKKELQPYIESHYHTSMSRTIIGESLGGLLATEILLKEPTLFDRYIIISPSLWWDNGSLLNVDGDVLKANYPYPVSIYIGVGKEGLPPGATPRVMEVDANVLADKIKSSQNKNVNVYFDYLPQEDHATIAHQAVYDAFRWIYQPKAK